MNIFFGRIPFTQPTFACFQIFNDRLRSVVTCIFIAEITANVQNLNILASSKVVNYQECINMRKETRTVVYDKELHMRAYLLNWFNTAIFTNTMQKT